MVSRIACLPSTYVISSYSNVRLQQPSTGLSVESQMPMDIMLNPILADEPPAVVDKMESIFTKNEPVKNLKTIDIDEKTIMESINKQIIPTEDNAEETTTTLYDESDFIAVKKEQPMGFSVASDLAKADNWLQTRSKTLISHTERLWIFKQSKNIITSRVETMRMTRLRMLKIVICAYDERFRDSDFKVFLCSSVFKKHYLNRLKRYRKDKENKLM